METRSPHIMILAGEYSGSLYGSLMARRIRELAPDARLTGVGGHHLQEAGVEILFDSSNWGGIGPMEALKLSPWLAFVYFRLKSIIRSQRPDLVILIDYPGFNMLVARVAKSLGIPTLYYFPPGKYRSAPEDVLDAARTITRVAAPLQLAFDKYNALHAKVDFVGHPLLDILPEAVDAEAVRAELGVKPEEQVIGLLPGSRIAELEYHTPVLCRAAGRLAARGLPVRFFIPLVNTRHPDLQQKAMRLIQREISQVNARIEVLTEDAPKVMAISRLLLVSSGTATLEAAYYGTPMVIVYRVSKLTEFLAPFFHHMPFKFVGLPNIIADRAIVPELVQDQLTEDNLVREALAILENAERDREIRTALKELVPTLGSKGASERVARIALEMAAGWEGAAETSAQPRALQARQTAGR